MSNDKVRYPSTGCVVEFMQGNAPQLGIVLEEHGGRLRLYTQGKREVNLTVARLLPWYGPNAGASLSRHQMEQMMEQVDAQRTALRSEVNIEDLWALAQGEVFKADIDWLASLVWSGHSVDHQAALGRVLLQSKTHFRFSPPDFEIFTTEMVEKKLQESENLKLREMIAGKGASFFQLLWEIHLCKRSRLQAHEMPEAELAARLKRMLFDRIADAEHAEEDALWRLLVKALPEHPFLPLLLVIAWGILPEHYNFYFDRAGFESGQAWASSFANDVKKLQEDFAAVLHTLPPLLAADGSNPLALISVDPENSLDRDDAFWVEKDGNGNFRVVVALACPAFVWPFGSELDKAVLKRQSSLYLPEGDEHMLPAEAGWQLFGLDEGQKRPALYLDIKLTAEAEISDFSLGVACVKIAKNFNLLQSEGILRFIAHGATRPSSSDGQDVDNDTTWEEFIKQDFLPDKLQEKDVALTEIQQDNDVGNVFAAALELSKLLQAKRIGKGAVVTERTDPEIRLDKKSDEIQVVIADAAPTPMSFLIIGEIMIMANAIAAEWAITNEVPLFFKVQDVTIPKDFAGVWTSPADISRVVRSLPAASLDINPKRHAGLGLAAYTSVTAPIRRYVDLLNQGQVVSFVTFGKPRFSREEIASLQSQITARLEGVMQIQRSRPRYWKLMYLRQQGAKTWWNAVVTEENNHFVGVAIPSLQIFLRGKRNLFGEKTHVGQDVQVRIAKVVPLLGEMSLVESREID